MWKKSRVEAAIPGCIKEGQAAASGKKRNKKWKEGAVGK